MTLKKTLQTDIEALKAMRDEDIDYSDIPSIDTEWAKSVEWEVMHPEKRKGVFIMLDQEVLDYFQSPGKGYQGRINTVLRRYIEKVTEQTQKQA
jgi:uncharacterized protein (DUF4415 family)